MEMRRQLVEMQASEEKKTLEESSSISLAVMTEDLVGE